MNDMWEERRKALENEYFHRVDARLIEQLRCDSREKLIKELCRNRCPKCGDQIQAMEFRGVPLDRCPSCGGVWLGPCDLQILSEKDHRTWFDRWFGEEK